MGRPTTTHRPAGFFQILDRLPPTDPDLKTWTKWFESRKIETVLVERKDGKVELWREGRRA